MTPREFIKKTVDELPCYGLEYSDPVQHTELMVRSFLNWSYTELYQRQDEVLSEHEIEFLEKGIASRIEGTPLQYLTGVSHFWKDAFRVGPGVLIPRPETELLVEKIIELPLSGDAKIAELGAGTGAIGISVLKEKPQLRWIGYEKSDEAYQFLKGNLSDHDGMGKRFIPILGDFFEKAPFLAPFDVIVANPPYIPSREIGFLSKEVRKEPRLALDGGVDGFHFLERLIDLSSSALKLKGWLICEFGNGQEIKLKELLSQHSFSFQFFDDLNGVCRIFVAQKESPWTR